MQSLGTIVYLSEWHKMPPKYRKYYVPLIIHSQHVQYISGYGILTASLGMYLKASCVNMIHF